MTNIEKAQAELSSLQSNGKRWRAEEGGEYWAIWSDGEVSDSEDEFDSIDNHRYETGNYFRTEAEAHRALYRMIATQQLKDRIAELNAEQGWVADWGDANQSKYLAAFEHQNKRKLLATYGGYSYAGSPIEFYGSLVTIETVIKEMPEQIKLWLGVK